MEEITLLLNKFCNNNKKFPPPATLPDWISSGKSSAGLKSADTSTASREATSSALHIKSMHYIAQVINALHRIERSSKSTHQQLQEGGHHPYCTVCQWVKFKTDTSTALREATSSVLHSLSMTEVQKFFLQIDCKIIMCDCSRGILFWFYSIQLSSPLKN